MADLPEVKLRDILLEAGPAFVSCLKRLAGVKSQEALAEVLGVGANAISRYKRGQNLPTSLPAYFTTLGCSRRQAGWLIGEVLQKQFADGRLDLDAQPDEIREPHPRYDERSLERALAEIEAYDFGVLEAEEMVDFNQDRNAIRDACRELLAERETASERFERLLDTLLGLIERFRRRAEKAVRRARQRGR